MSPFSFSGKPLFQGLIPALFLAFASGAEAATHTATDKTHNSSHTHKASAVSHGATAPHKAQNEKAAKAKPRKGNKPLSDSGIAVDYLARPEVQEFIQHMVQSEHFDEAELRNWFAQARQLPSVLKAIQPPATLAARSWSSYRSRFVEPIRIRAGLNFWATYESTLDRAAKTYQVPAEIIAAILGVETIYGRNAGHYQVFSALTTLAFDYPPRAELFRRELGALMLLAREEKRSPLSYQGSYAGALGMPQFLPSSWRSWAVDFNQDQRIDLNDPEDAIGSVANFLAAHGWQAGKPIIAQAQVANEEQVKELLAEGIQPRRLPAELAAWGVQTWPTTPAQPVALLDYASPDEPTQYRLGYQNFYVITRYNRSTFYATSVFDLAEALKNARRQNALP